ncbi:N-acetylneuraminate synthase family protein [Amylibacter sp.]|jgi:sialic acid synthase SpsE|nr:N-acetylneuraminate synthase family protein [Amylibacter sp.]
MDEPKSVLNIDQIKIGNNYPTYFIADLAANHDGDLERAKDLIYLAADRGANAAKFQHFSAGTIVSDKGFRSLTSKASHQSNWKKSVYDIYKDASIDLSWSAELKETCDKAGISFFTSPYSETLLNHINPYVSAHKIGSGDITWLDMIKLIAKKNKPTILASGASSFDDVVRALDTLLSINSKVCLMQCNTNYTASLENFKYIQLNVLKAYRQMYPGLVLGLSDHTPGHATVLGAVALGARMIEKHLTDDNERIGPDHKFSMNGNSWQQMVERTRELESALGDGVKRVEDNEKETVVLQRRSIHCTKNLTEGHVITADDLIALRPCPPSGILPFYQDEIIGKILVRDMNVGEGLSWQDLN